MRANVVFEIMMENLQTFFNIRKWKTDKNKWKERKTTKNSCSYTNFVSLKRHVDKLNNEMR